MIRLKNALLSIVYCLTLVACGGGGDSAPTRSADNPIQLPPSINVWEPLVPQYTGSRSTFEITKANASPLILDLTSIFDLLQSLSYDQWFNQLKLYEANAETFNLSEEPTCQSGSTNTETDTGRSRATVTYNNCSIDGVIVHGVIRIFASGPESDPLSIFTTNLDIEVREASETLFFAGHYKKYLNERAVFQLAIDGNDEEQIYFENFAVGDPIDEVFRRIEYNGDVYFANSGKLSIVTTSYENLESNKRRINLSFIGDKTLSVEAILQETMTISIEGISDTLTIPLSLDFDPPPEQVAPIAIVSVGEAIEYGDTLSIDASASRDANFEFLNYSWDIVNTVNGAVTNISDNSASVITFTSDKPGNYQIVFTVSDGSGLSDQQVIDFRVKQKPPIAEIELVKANYKYGEAITAEVKTSNVELDGPFEYIIEYGPSNIRVDSNGAIIWDGLLPNFGQDLNVYFGIQVSNQDASTIVESSIIMQPTEMPTSTPILVKPNSNVTLGNYEDLFVKDILSSAFSIDNGMIIEKVSKLPKSLLRHSNIFVKSHDYDGDGISDFWFLMSTENEDVYDIVVSNGNTLSIETLGEIEIQSDDFVSDVDLDFFDISNDGIDDIFVYNRRINPLKTVINPISGDYLYKGEIEEWADILPRNTNISGQLCDIDDDGLNETYISSGQFHFVANFADKKVTTEQIQIEDSSRIYSLNDDTGKVSCYMLVINIFSEPDTESDIYLYNVKTGNKTYIPNSSFFASDDEEIRVLSATPVNLDDDLSSEVLIRIAKNNLISFETTYNAVIVDNVHDQKPNFYLVNNDFKNNEYGYAFMDIFGDSKKEIIFSEPQSLIINGRDFGFSGNSVEKAYSLINDEFEQIATSNSISVPLSSSYYWGADNSLSLGQKTLVQLKDSKKTFVAPTSESTALLIAEGNQVVKYNYNFNETDGSTSLHKLTFENVLQWESGPISIENHSIDEVIPITEKFLLIIGSIRDPFLTIIDRSSGEILFTSEKSEYVINNEDLLKYYRDGAWYIPIVSVDNSRDGKFLELKEDGTVSAITNDQITSFFSEFTQRDFFGFTQVDKDPQAELVRYQVDGIDETLLFMDIKSFTIEERSLLNKAETVRNKGLTNRVLDKGNCLPWALDCRNYIVNTNSLDAASASKFFTAEMDKRNGKTIWQTSNRSEALLGFEVRFVDNKVVYLAHSNGNWFIVE
ncbi:PKD domain-containing protein [Glaciecola petra]|uniref:PKD domain-containing protein n=1 Tax=Glaciecola petra TaxID=3075602 RepID=A0ABU2ZX20_9ALTE|nr:PKD domain-containing protein [Aestuariibacter sp. P117]MDT0596573.1 PKD domain-containing protein [Aestuariibacter sp. P117]